MKWKRKAGGGLIGLIGYLLSPLSWWNDAVINLPLSVGFGWLIALFYKPAFEASVVVGYWLTNVLGFVLMHKGASTMIGGPGRRYSWRSLGKDISISLLYTAIIVVLIKAGVLRPFENYFPNR